MSRRINTGLLVARPFGVTSGAAVAPAPAPDTSYDDYLSRLAKNIPGEIVAFYLVCAAQISPNASSPNYPGLWIVFGLGCLLVPLYFIAVTKREDKPPLWSQVVLASISFPVWVFAIGGPFTQFHWYQSSMASVMLAFITVVSGLYKPDKGA